MHLDRWVVDRAYSSITFRIPHLAVAKVRGRFNSFSGRLLMNDESYSDSVVEIRIQADSVDTNEPMRDREARSATFLDVEHYPEIVFRSTEIIGVRDEGVSVAGYLTLHGAQKPLEIDVRFVGRTKDFDGCERMSWEAEFSIHRTDFGLLWHPALENVAGFVLADSIDVTCELEFLREECAKRHAESALAETTDATR